jgi:hypothetical protein
MADIPDIQFLKGVLLKCNALSRDSGVREMRIAPQRSSCGDLVLTARRLQRGYLELTAALC